MNATIQKLKHFPGLNEEEDRIYRNFNLFLVIGLLDLIIVVGALVGIQPYWPLYLCALEFVGFLLMLYIHTKGYFLTARYISFFLALTLQAMASLTHGKGAGFDYIFYIITVLPMLFFSQKRHYITLSLISLSTLLAIQYFYTITTPIIILDTVFTFYWNILFTGVVIIIIIASFKKGYQKQQKSLLEQNRLILQQKEEIEVINNNLEQLVVDRTEKLKSHEQRFTEFAHINAHKVRSPLARILGLLNLIEIEKDKEKTMQEFLPSLKDNAEELNEILREVSVKLNDPSGPKTNQ